MPSTYTRFTPACGYCLTGYVTYLMGPRGGVHMVWPCMQCDRMPPKKPSGYIPLKPARRRRHANEDAAA